jgi:Cdc6-like AAA superfamily ATPase
LKDLISLLIEEFNCNAETLDIYKRETEKERIINYLDTNYTKGKSGLLYLCGHPGTGKTSSLNALIKTKFKIEYEHLMIFSYNAMSFRELSSFVSKLYEDLSELIKIKASSLQVAGKRGMDLTDKINAVKELLRSKSKYHKLIVIDEIDNFA